MRQSNHEDQAARPYWVVIDDQQELAIWPGGRDLPEGWQRTEKHGTRGECLAFIKWGRVSRPSHKSDFAHYSPQ